MSTGYLYKCGQKTEDFQCCKMNLYYYLYVFIISFFKESVALFIQYFMHLQVHKVHNLQKVCNILERQIPSSNIKQKL